MFPAASKEMSRPLAVVGEVGRTMRFVRFGIPSSSGRMVMELLTCLMAARYLPSNEISIAAVERRISPLVVLLKSLREATRESQSVVELSLERTKIDVLVVAGSSRFSEIYHFPPGPRTTSAS